MFILLKQYCFNNLLFFVIDIINTILIYLKSNNTRSRLITLCVIYLSHVKITLYGRHANLAHFALFIAHFEA